MRQLLSILYVLLLNFALGSETDNRTKRVFPVFEIVRFPNDACESGTEMGTCFTAEECTANGGNGNGACANGYGVCCIFTVSCGQMSNQNCTYFNSNNNNNGLMDGTSCKAEICPCNDNICQLRLDFLQFNINQPQNLNLKNAILVNGAPFQKGIVPATATVTSSDDTRCMIDSFAVTSPGNTAPPVICGMNNGQHMYVEASDCCHILSFNLGMGGGMGVNRQWNIKVTQYSCDYNNLAPEGCTKYFFPNDDDNEMTVQSYNFGGGSHLADQREKICVRREVNTCQICWFPTQGNNFDITGTMKGKQRAGLSAMCCGNGIKTTSFNTIGYDCVVIPGAETRKGSRVKVDEFCGGGFTTNQKGFYLGTIASMATSTSVAKRQQVCSRKLPFVLSFYSDSFETNTETKGPIFNRGFSIQYQLNDC